MELAIPVNNNTASLKRFLHDNILLKLIGEGELIQIHARVLGLGSNLKFFLLGGPSSLFLK
jgi:hypothetical protein